MATITKSIGTNARDYSTVTLWEADMDLADGVYTGSDDAVGEMYNDSDFDEEVTINGAAPATIHLTVAESDRHDGTAGTGARFLMSGHKQINFGRNDVELSWFEIDGQGAYACAIDNNTSSRTGLAVHHCIGHGYGGGGSGTREFIFCYRSSITIYNNVAYDISSSTALCEAIRLPVNSGSQACLVMNNTIDNIHGGNTDYGIRYDDWGGVQIYNNIVTGSDNYTYSPAAPTGASILYNMADDSGATGGFANINNVTRADQYVSIVGGSEDYHLASTSDAIGTGVPLSIDDKTDIDGHDRAVHGMGFGSWSMGADQPPKELTHAIGTSGRNFSTITLWESTRSDDTVFLPGDSAVGECYDDSDFDETVTFTAQSNVATTTLTAPESERHDGTTGAGVVVGDTALNNSTFTVQDDEVTIEWMQVVDSGNGNDTGIYVQSGGDNCTIRNSIIYTENDGQSNVDDGIIFLNGATGGEISNCVLHGGWTSNTIEANEDTKIYNCSCHNRVGPGVRNAGNDAGSAIEPRNTISFADGGSDYSDGGESWGANAGYNLGGDTTTPGSNSIDNAVVTDIFTSTTLGSEDFHLVAGCDAVGAGEDLGASYEIDIDGDDRDLGGRAWDIGADQRPGAITKTIGTSSRDYSTIALWEAELNLTNYIQGDTPRGEMYDDSVFAERNDFRWAGADFADVELTAASTDRHDGTNATGVRIETPYRTNGTGAIQMFAEDNTSLTISWICIKNNGSNGNQACLYEIEGSASHMILDEATSNNTGGVRTINVDFAIDNSIILDTGYRGIYGQSGSTAVRNVSMLGVRIDQFAGPMNVWNTISTSTPTGSLSTDTANLWAVTGTDHFTSTVKGSEDAHLISTSSAIGAGTDLGTDYAIDIDGDNRAARTDWSIGADEPAGAEVVKSIGTSSRDYSTTTLWAADLADETVYIEGDHAIGECYNDSVFTDAVYFQSALLSSATLKAADSERHDGTVGTGVRIEASSGSSYTYTVNGTAAGNESLHVDGLEITNDGTYSAGMLLYSLGDPDHYFSATRNIIHGLHCTAHNLAGEIKGIGVSTPPSNNETISDVVANNIIYNLKTSGTNYSPIFGIDEVGSSIRRHRWVNNTIHDIEVGGISTVSDAIGYFTTDSGSQESHYYNNIATSVVALSSGSEAGVTQDCFRSQHTIGNADHQNNMSDDATAVGTGSLTSVATDQYVSIVEGAEDLHLKTGSDAIGAGKDLSGEVYATEADSDIDGDYHSTRANWSIGADEPGGIEVVKSIGTTARDYSTATLWAADFEDPTVYIQGDTALGECYADSDFTEQVSIGETNGYLQGVHLTAAVAERHDGTANTGVRFLGDCQITLATQTGTPQLAERVSWLEMDGDGLGDQAVLATGADYTATGVIDHMLCHGHAEGNIYNGVLRFEGRDMLCHNNVLYDFERNGSTGPKAIYADCDRPEGGIYNNTVHNSKATSTGAIGVNAGITVVSDDTDGKVYNNIVTDVTDVASSATFSGCIYFLGGTSNVTGGNNATSDATATVGTGNFTNVVAADIYVSAVEGSEDLHIQQGSELSGAGASIAVDSVEIDIDGEDRSIEDRWSIGADEPPPPLLSTVGTNSRDYTTLTLFLADVETEFGVGEDGRGELYADSDFDEIVNFTCTADHLNSLVITAAEAERHDGTPGTGVRFVHSSDGTIDIDFNRNDGGGEYSWIEHDGNGTNNVSVSITGTYETTNTPAYVHHVIVHDYYSTDTLNNYSLRAENRSCAYSNLVYDIKLGTSAIRGLRIGYTSTPSPKVYHNSTVYGVSRSGGGYDVSNGFRQDSNSVWSMAHNIAAFDNTGDITVTGPDNVSSHFAISDSNTTYFDEPFYSNLTAADEFVSVVDGSEDFTPKAGSTIAESGMDPAASYATAGYSTGPDYNLGLDGAALDRTDNWPIGAYAPAGGTITKTIGTTSRDYSTITLWEADLSTEYFTDDTPIGDCYNDSVFSENVALNGHLNAILQAAEGERHDGTKGTGAKLEHPGGDNYLIAPVAIEAIRWMEIDGDSGSGFTGLIQINSGLGKSGQKIENNLLYGNRSSGTRYPVTGTQQAYGNPAEIRNNFFIGNANWCTGALTLGDWNIRNNTCYSTSGNGISGGAWTTPDIDVSNNVVITGGADFAGNIDTSSTNASGDASAPDATFTNVVAADTFTSTVSGTEDLHLLSTSPLVGAGTDFGADYAIDIDGQERKARGWSIGADEVAATVIKSIGTNARDYSSIDLWEADQDTADGVYFASDAAIGECYADSNFSISSRINLNRDNASLQSITLTAAEGEEHDGTLGSGVQLDDAFASFSNYMIDAVGYNITISKLQFNLSAVSNYPNFGVNIDYPTARNCEVTRCLFHSDETDSQGSGTIGVYVNNSNGTCRVHNNFFVSLGVPVQASYPGTSVIANNTSYGRGNGTGVLGITAVSTMVVTNNLMTNHTNDLDNASGTFRTNATEDATGDVTGIVPADTFVSTTAGSEDLHLVSTASSVIGAGTDEGSAYEIDIDGQNREPRGIWSIGADEAPTTITKTIGTNSRDYSTVGLFGASIHADDDYFADDTIIGEMYADSTFVENTASVENDAWHAQVQLTAAETDRHDGTAGTGVQFEGYLNILGDGSIDDPSLMFVSWIEISVGDFCRLLRLSSATVDHCILHNITDVGGNPAVAGGGIITGNQGRSRAYNNIIYDLVATTSVDRYAGIDMAHNSPGRYMKAYNNTIYGVESNHNDTRAFGIMYGDSSQSANECYNNIAIGTGGTSTETIEDIYLESYGGDDLRDYNLTGDGTGGAGANNITDGVAADLFVSIVPGSEDLHLKSDAVAIGAGNDYSDLYENINTDIDGMDRSAGAGRVWDIGADQLPGEVVWTIGTSGRDYSSFALWEADLDTLTTEDHAVGEVHHDSTITENFTFSLPTPDSITVRPAEADKHDGTSNAATVHHLRMYSNFGGSYEANLYIEDMDIERTSANGTDSFSPIFSFNGNNKWAWIQVDRCLLQDLVRQRYSPLHFTTHNWRVSNCMVFNVNLWDTGDWMIATSKAFRWNHCFNNTFYTGGGSSGSGIHVGTEANHRVVNNIVSSFGTDMGGGGGIEEVSNNITVDGTAIGTDSVANVVEADQWVSTLSGSEDLHLASTSDAIGAGVQHDTYNNVQYDIDGFDRMIGGRDWDVGADQRAGVVRPTIGTSSRDYSTITLFIDDLPNYLSGDDVYAECYADSVFEESLYIRNDTHTNVDVVELAAAETDRHDGTAGTGVVIQPPASPSWVELMFVQGQAALNRVSWLELDVNENSGISRGFECASGTTVDHMLVHSVDTNLVSVYGMELSGSSGTNNSRFFNNIVYNIHRNDGSYGSLGIRLNGNSYNAQLYNSTVYNCTGPDFGDGGNIAFAKNNSVNKICRNCISVAVNGAYSISNQTNNTIEYNATNDIYGGTNKQVVDTSDFISVVSGSEDLHLVDGSAAYHNGWDIVANLADYGDAANLDIDQEDRSLDTGWSIGADQGEAGGLAFNADSGAWSLLGQSMEFRRSLRLPADAGSFGLSGQAVEFSEAIRLMADAGGFNLSGQPMTFTADGAWSAASGSFSQAGQSVDFVRDLGLSVDSGSFNLSGQETTRTRSLVLLPGSGSFSIDGQDMDFASDGSLNADEGLFTASGQEARFLKHYHIGAASGSFGLTGFTAETRLDRVLSAGSGSFNLDGQAINAIRDYVLTGETGVFGLAGQNVDLRRDLLTIAGHGIFGLSGQDVDLDSHLRFAAEQGVFSLTGIAPELFISGVASPYYYLLLFSRRSRYGSLQ